MNRFRKFSLMLAFSLAVFINPAFAAPPFEESWLEQLRQDARNHGVSEQTIRQKLTTLIPIEKFPARSEQKEFSKAVTLADYLKMRVTETNINTGIGYMDQYISALREDEAKYKVPPQYILAIWAIETHFGRNTGAEDVISSLVTLARDHPDADKRKQFRSEAIAALKLIDRGYDEINGKGSWAGAVGQPQFLPSNILKYGVDLNGDGKNDIWNNHEEVFASIANFLSQSRLGNWHEGERWGREVTLPHGFDPRLLTDTLKDQRQKTPDEWRKLGVKLPDGKALPAEDEMKGVLIAPDGMDGRVFLVYNNFKSIMGYNPTFKYALAVGFLADAIAARPPSPATPGIN